MRWIIAIFLLVSAATAALSQEPTPEEDKGRITRYLEEALSGLGREVRIDGFRGALSSRVSMDRMTISDDEGVWLTLTDAVLDWNRTAILRGRIEIEQISASRIDVARAPVAEEAASPEASGGFSLPELPVSIDIKSVSVQEATLGETILGMPIALTLDGSVAMADGQGQADLSIERLQGPRGSFKLNASYANQSRQLVLDLNLDEAKDGIVSTLLNLPGHPALEMTARADAPIDALVVDVALKSDGEDRLTGQIGTSTEAASQAADGAAQDGPRIVRVDIAGDITPLFVPQYQTFFGRNVGLKSLVRLFPDGRVTLENLNLTAAALQLEGSAAVAAGGMPESFQLRGLLEQPDQSAVLLPLSGPETRVTRARLEAAFDASRGDVWTLTADLEGLERPDMSVDFAEISADGTIRSEGGREVTARIESVLRGFEMADEALSQALGEAFALNGDLRWREGQPLDLQDIRLTGEGMALTGAGQLETQDGAMVFDGALEADVDEIARFSGLAGRPLAGGIQAGLKGRAGLPTGAFDLDLTATGSDLRVGIDKVDGVLGGQSRLSVSAKRDETGLTLRDANVETTAASVRASGFMASDKANFEFGAALDNLSRFVAGISGPVKLTGDATRNETGWLVDLDGTGPLQSQAKAHLAMPDDSGLSVELSGVIGNVGALLSDLAGRAQFTASARQDGENWIVDTKGTGPGGSTFAIAGQVRADATHAALDIDGSLPMALANRRLRPIAAQGQVLVDLRLDGPIGLSSVSGRLSTSGARVSVPSLQNSLTDLNATIGLNGSVASISTSAALATGGRLAVDGQVGLQAPYSTNLAVQILNAVIRDPRLFETEAQGNLIVSGTAPANLNVVGRINLLQTEIRVPSTGLGLGSLPDIRHVNEPGDVRQTRGYAGMLDAAGEADSSGGIAVGLDVLIAADNKVFIRGRGLDAELGGRFRVTGTSADLVPVGAFNLIRGRLDLLGKRLNLDEGSATLQGDFIPTLRLVASTVSADDTAVRIVVQGRANAPEISFESEPSLPQDEVLARLLFGRDLSSLSAFQALRLASAVATLTGKGGGGLTEGLRKATGLDDFSISSDADGGATVGAGKYLSENIYTDVQIGDQSNTQINLNIDLSRRTKLRGQLGSDGNTGVGIFFEKDY